MNDHKDHDKVDDIDCMDAIEHLYSYLDGELTDPGAIAEFEKHLKHCENCYTRKELETKLSKRLKKSSKDEVPETLQSRLKNIMDNLD
jgi:anti-sigma factor (TIGR02949 family)